MTDALLSAVLWLGDLLLGWLLYLPHVAAVAVLALLTSLLMALVRRWTTNQDLLARAHADKKRLKELIREAKAEKDKARLARHRATNGRVALKLLRAEGKPLLAALLPIAFIGTWGWFRLAYVAPSPGETVQLELSLPFETVGDLVYLVPQEGLQAIDGTVRQVQPGSDGPPHGLAVWQVTARERAQPYRVELNHGRRRLAHPLLVGQQTYAAATVQHEPGALLPQSYARMQVPRIAGLVRGPHPDEWGGVGAMLPAWVLTYIIFVLPLYLIGKRVFGIY